ncbi:MAG: hypothetical protein ACRC6V_10515 [Bacteroidales bacterium]
MRAQSKTPVMGVPYRVGTPASAIIMDGWSRDFKPTQTLSELKMMEHTNVTMYDVVQMFGEYDNLYAEDMDELSQNRQG